MFLRRLSDAQRLYALTVQMDYRPGRGNLQPHCLSCHEVSSVLENVHHAQSRIIKL